MFVISLVIWRVNIMTGTPFVFRSFPFIKGLIHNQEAHLIAEIIELRHMRIVTHTDGIASHFL